VVIEGLEFRLIGILFSKFEIKILAFLLFIGSFSPSFSPSLFILQKAPITKFALQSPES
jgi:hypothetical protein